MAGHHGNIGIGLLSGMIGGLVGTLAMSQARTILLPPDKPADWGKRERELRGRSSGSDDATDKAANWVARATLKRNLNKQEKKVAGPLVHYLTGAVPAVLYGVAVELAPPLDKTFGLPLSLAMWLADETIVPALHLTKRSQDLPPSTHLYSLATHMVYGIFTDLVRRLLNIILLATER